jgi:hypothetical protein
MIFVNKMIVSLYLVIPVLLKLAAALKSKSTSRDEISVIVGASARYFFAVQPK